MDFLQKIVFIGFGAVARSTLPILIKHVHVPLKQITIIDAKRKDEELARWIEKGVTFRQVTITRDNLETVLSGLVSEGDLIIDLSLNIDCAAILTWCHAHQILYINASVEVWDPYSDQDQEFPYEKTLHFRHSRLVELTRSWKDAPTCIVDHGANPGLISHFARKGLVDITTRMISDGIVSDPDHLKDLIAEKRYGELAMEIGVRVVHCSEIDLQVSRNPKQENVFINTWSVEGFYEEAIAPAEIGWGTHEQHLPGHSYRPEDGPDNELIIRNMGLNTWIRSWVPDQEICGMVIRHGEAFGISDRWSVVRDGSTVYRPTVCYVYRPCNQALESLEELRQHDCRLQENQQILSVGDISGGEDILGALLMGHPYTAWWTGSILSIEEAEKLETGQNATTVQVGIGMVAAIMWMIEHPREGFCLPDDLPYEYILDVAIPYLGSFHSVPTSWTPDRKSNEGNRPGEDSGPEPSSLQFPAFVCTEKTRL